MYLIATLTDVSESRALSILLPTKIKNNIFNSCTNQYYSKFTDFIKRQLCNKLLQLQLVRLVGYPHSNCHFPIYSESAKFGLLSNPRDKSLAKKDGIYLYNLT